MDFQKYSIKLTIRACMMFERLTGKSFYDMATDDDLMHLLYTTFITSNPTLTMTYQVFTNFIKDKKINAWITKEYKKLSDINAQFIQQQQEQDGNDIENTVTITDIATSLILKHGMDAHYIMEEMQVWEILPLFKTADNIRKQDLEEKRLWAYLQIAPMIDGKKIKGPKDILPFEWEKENKQNNFEKNAATAFNFLSQQQRTDE